MNYASIEYLMYHVYASLSMRDILYKDDDQVKRLIKTTKTRDVTSSAAAGISFAGLVFIGNCLLLTIVQPDNLFGFHTVYIIYIHLLRCVSNITYSKHLLENRTTSRRT